jgi:aminoglycoside phosphotransferase (APT) family kinase protein
MSIRDPAIENRMQSIAVHLYGLAAQIYRYHSEISYVCRLHFGGDRPDKVIKYARSNGNQVLREQQVLRTLAAAGLQVPRVEFTQDDCAIASAPFFIMPKLATTTLQDACWSGGEWIESVLRQAGRFIARLSSVPPDVLRASPASYMVGWEKAALSDLDRWAFVADLSKDERERFKDHLHRIARLASRKENGLMHGSFSPGHILCDGKGTFAVIDWENAGPGFVLRDAGHFLASLRTWAGGETQHAGWFMDGLQGERSLRQKDRSEIRDWEMFTLSIWANYFTRQGHQEPAKRILDAVRVRLTSNRGDKGDRSESRE